MSMNFSEFKKLLGADPLNRDPETLHARASGDEFEQAAREAEDFERRLKGALDVAVDSDSLTAEIIAAPRASQTTSPIASSKACLQLDGCGSRRVSCGRRVHHIPVWNLATRHHRTIR